MKESQRTEWKESWRDEHLRWVCGFANADGGVLVIGRNDKGRVVGISDAARLLGDRIAPEATPECTDPVGDPVADPVDTLLQTLASHSGRLEPGARG